MQDEGDFDAEEIFEELSEDDKFYVMAGEPIGKVTRNSIRGCTTITDIDSMNFGETEDEGRQIALANARLIAAAPELLKALENIINEGLSTSKIAAGKAAITKATGETT
jgi:hypothetical protein